MKNAIKVLYVILILILLKFIFTYTVNEIYKSRYEKGKYNESLVKCLGFLNISESYIANYNYGNYFYQNGKYTEAINEYNKALESNPPKGKECSIRINKALCILESVDLEKKEPKENIKILKKARSVLTEQGCAHVDDDKGHSKEAEQLKKEIDELIKKLEKEDPTEPEPSPEPSPDPSNSPSPQPSPTPSNAEETIEERMKEAEEERRKELENSAALDKWEYSTEEKIW